MDDTYPLLRVLALVHPGMQPCRHCTVVIRLYTVTTAVAIKQTSSYVAKRASMSSWCHILVKSAPKSMGFGGSLELQIIFAVPRCYRDPAVFGEDLARGHSKAPGQVFVRPDLGDRLEKCRDLAEGLYACLP